MALGPVAMRGICKFRRAALAAATVLAVGAVAIGAGPAQAQDEDDNPSLDQRLIRSLMGGGAARPDIDYRERSPLVIPRGRELPAPGARNALPAGTTAAWPNDPDQKAAPGDRGGPRSAHAAAEREARSLSPNEMRRGARAGAGRNTGPVPTPNDNEMGRALRPDELGAPTVWNAFRSSSAKDEKFTREPDRTRMTDPPAGYRTPVPTQPYRAPSDTGSLFKIPTFFDRGTDPNQ